MTLLQRSVEILRKDPYQTAWELACILEAEVSTVSAILYRDTIRRNPSVNRRPSGMKGRGYEYYVPQQSVK